MENLYPLQNHHIVICERTGELGHNDSWWVERRQKKRCARERRALEKLKNKKRNDIFMTDTKTLARKASDPAQRLKNVKFFRRSRKKMCWEFFHSSSYEKLYSHSAIHWSRHISSPGWAHESLLKRHKKIVAMRQNKKKTLCVEDNLDQHVNSCYICSGFNVNKSISWDYSLVYL